VTGTPGLGRVREVLDEALAAGVAPAISAEVRAAGRPAHASVHGVCGERPLAASDLFDVASLTKVMATGTVAARLIAAGRLSLDAPAGRWLPGFADEKGAITLRHLLAHTSGLPAWRPFFRGHGGEMPFEAALAAEPLEAPPGARTRYSDLGFAALGMALERIAAAPLDVLFEREVAGPLALRDTLFLPARAPRLVAEGLAAHRFVPTVVRETGEVRRGEAHDENARALGGVAGQAGLFSTAAEVAALGQAWLDALAGRSGFLPSGVATLFATRDPTPGSTRALAWDTPSPEGSALGDRLGRGPRGAIGHLGFTGCSLWIDLDREVVCALLSSHCPRVGEGEVIRAFRRRFHDAVAEGLGI